MLDQDFIVCVHANWLIINFNKLYENFHTAIKKQIEDVSFHNFSTRLSNGKSLATGFKRTS